MKLIRKKLTSILGLKGSWKWAKKKMKKGEVVRCRHWSGPLKYKIDSPENGLLLYSHQRTPPFVKWETSNHHLSYEDFTDYEIVKQ